MEDPPLKRQALLPSQQTRQRQKLQHLDLVESTNGSETLASRADAGLLSSVATRASLWREDMSAAAAALLCIGSASSSDAWGQAPISAAPQPAHTLRLRSMSEASGSAASESSTWAAAAGGELGRPTARAASMPHLSHSQHSSRAGNGAVADERQTVPASGKQKRKSKAASSGQFGPEKSRCKCGERHILCMGPGLFEVIG